MFSILMFLCRQVSNIAKGDGSHVLAHSSDTRGSLILTLSKYWKSEIAHKNLINDGLENVAHL
jgi:hypothetical protein